MPFGSYHELDRLSSMCCKTGLVVLQLRYFVLVVVSDGSTICAYCSTIIFCLSSLSDSKALSIFVKEKIAVMIATVPTHAVGVLNVMCMTSNVSTDVLQNLTCASVYHILPMC